MPSVHSSPEITTKQGALRRVVATATERVATENTAQSLPTSTHRSVFLHSLDEIVTAGWREAATATKQRAEDRLIRSHKQDQAPSGGSRQPSRDTPHFVPLSAADRCVPPNEPKNRRRPKKRARHPGADARPDRCPPVCCLDVTETLIESGVSSGCARPHFRHAARRKVPIEYGATRFRTPGQPEHDLPHRHFVGRHDQNLAANEPAVA